MMNDVNPYRSAPPLLSPAARHVPFGVALPLRFGGFVGVALWFNMLVMTVGIWWGVALLRAGSDDGRTLIVTCSLVATMLVILLVITARRARRPLELLRYGRLSQARLVYEDELQRDGRGGPVWDMRFSFLAADGKGHPAMVRTRHHDELTDDEEEPLLYLESDPAVYALVDDLPGAPRVCEDDTVAPAYAVRTVAYLFFPVATVVANLVAACVVLGR